MRNSILVILAVLVMAATAHAYKRTETIREYGANVYCTKCEKVTWHGFEAEDMNAIWSRVAVPTLDPEWKPRPDVSSADWSLTCSVCGTVIQDDVRVTFKVYSGVEEKEVGNVHN